jgi:hypothetical protein
MKKIGFKFGEKPNFPTNFSFQTTLLFVLSLSPPTFTIVTTSSTTKPQVSLPR